MDDELTRPCGRASVHEPHVWLSRKDLWCIGTGEVGSAAPPRATEGGLGDDGGTGGKGFGRGRGKGRGKGARVEQDATT